MAFQAGQFETGKAFRCGRIVRPVDGGNALKSDPIQLLAHMREALGVAI